MSSVFETQQTIREILLKILDNHSLEQLNKIPEGFNNNIIWNVAHCVAAQQTLVYKLSGLPTMISEDFILKYRKGTKPEGDVSEEEVSEIKTFLLSTFEKTKNDFQSGLFVDYNEYTTSMGFTLKNVQDALDFNNYHEGIHTGIAMSLKKLV
ncbi:DinB family protein [Flavobacterium sp. KACC 22758]|uniref:DinB family protein n=1 Tax=Flavobacterium sp. KACC 22758 TaxID=3025667 RepID=UPI0023659E20|nr:DinB family protein [Flavobacterium sp. KACC 22758]WDF59492.1 DinB family protein [Flavobacterium sp. KACC 22758]